MTVTVIVHIEVKPGRSADFERAMQTNAEGARRMSGCVRFDVMRHRDDSLRFITYEVLSDSEAHDAHRKEPHFRAWVDFKASGGVASQTVHRCSHPGNWGLQSRL